MNAARNGGAFVTKQSVKNPLWVSVENGRMRQARKTMVF